MADYERDVRRILSDNGCTFVRHGKGDHDITVDGKIKSRHTANAIMKQAGIAHRF